MDGLFLNKKKEKVQLISSLRQKRGLENENKGTEEPAEDWQVAAELSGGVEKNQVREKAQCWNAAVWSPLLFVLSLRLELFPEGPLQLWDGQSKGEGAVRLWPDNPGFKRTLDQG